jgi:hypothetical protein
MKISIFGLGGSDTVNPIYKSSGRSESRMRSLLRGWLVAGMTRVSSTKLCHAGECSPAAILGVHQVVAHQEPAFD